MILCFGTLGTVLKYCKKGKITNKELVKNMTRTIDPASKYGDTDDIVSKLLACKSDFGDRSESNSKSTRLGNVVSGARNAKIEDVIHKFENEVIKLINADKIKEMVATLLEIIDNDTTLDNDRKMSFKDHLGITKEALLTQGEYVFPDFLARLFLYTVIEVDNKLGKDCVTEITQKYNEEALSKRNEIIVFKSISESLAQSNIGHSFNEDEANDEIPRERKFYDDIWNDNKDVDLSEIPNKTILFCQNYNTLIGTGNTDNIKRALVEIFQQGIVKCRIGYFIQSDPKVSLSPDLFSSINYFAEVMAMLLEASECCNQERIYQDIENFVVPLNQYATYLCKNMKPSHDDDSIWIPTRKWKKDKIDRDVLAHRMLLALNYNKICNGNIIV